ncbi:MAG: glycoside hydrolase family 2 TIM barrel-domain containing protein [Chitinophagaceae bacterium]
MKKIAILILLISSLQVSAQGKRWSRSKAKEWYHRQPWLVGCNFIPSTAVDEIAMWQPSGFDTATINRELGYAAGIGFNVIRVFLHQLVWQQDPAGMKERMGQFLTLASRHHIRVMFVLFDDCWNPHPHLGPQPAPLPGVHNSQWVECPGADQVKNPAAWPRLERYEKDILSSFKNDPRVLIWDLYNEPGNGNLGNQTLPLLKMVFAWARQVSPSQPLTAGIWDNHLHRLSNFQLENEDIITFHNYDIADSLKNEILRLKPLGRPLICSEYMARTHGSLFTTCLPVLKKYDVGAINWGLVKGETNTIFPWGSKAGSPEPRIWFHDIFHRDGRPFDPAETRLIQKLTGRNE